MQGWSGQTEFGHYPECLLCLKMAGKEQTNDDMFQRDKALLEAYLKGQVSCLHRPHHSYSKDKEWFYKPGEGLKIHHRSSHQGQEKTKYDESLINKATFMLFQESQALDIKPFLENKWKQASATGTLNGSCCSTVQYPRVLE